MLKKLNKVFQTLLTFTFFITLFFTGCQTLPVENSVKAVDLLDNESAFYLAIPASVDPRLTVRLLQNNIPNLSEKNAQLISERISNIYCGLNHKKNKTEIQIAADARLGNDIASKILTVKNGFTVSKVQTSSQKNHDVYSNGNLSLSFPSDEIALIGRDIPVLLEQHDLIKASGNTVVPPKLDEIVYNYLSTAEDEIRFYAGRPQSFLTILTGANLDLRLESVSGSFVCDKKYPNQYIVDLSFNFKSEAFLKAGKGLLTLAFGLTNANSEIINNTELHISGILISKESLYKILVF